MTIMNTLHEFFTTGNRFVVTTKYPYELTAVISDCIVLGILNDWKVAAKFSDVVNEHARLKQMDSDIPNIEDLKFIYFHNVQEGKDYIIADYYIEDMYVL